MLWRSLVNENLMHLCANWIHNSGIHGGSVHNVMVWQWETMRRGNNKVRIKCSYKQSYFHRVSRWSQEKEISLISIYWRNLEHLKRNRYEIILSVSVTCVTKKNHKILLNRKGKFTRFIILIGKEKPTRVRYSSNFLIQIKSLQESLIWKKLNTYLKRLRIG